VYTKYLNLSSKKVSHNNPYNPILLIIRMSLTEEQKKKEALSVSIKEGSAANAMSSFGDQYITPAILALQGTAAHVGVLNALAGIAGPAAQSLGSRLLKNHSEKEVVTKTAFLQAICWILIAAIPLIYLKIQTSIPLYALLALYTLMIVLAGILHPAFFSWMGSLVKKKERGKYFSKRGAIVGAVGLITVLLSALILDFFKRQAELFVGLSLLFILAAICRIISFSYFKRQYEPKRKSKIALDNSWKKYLSMHTNIGRFTLGMAAFNFALMIASPFFAVYLLQERGYSYLMYTIVTMSGAAWYLIFLPLVGKFSDKYGNASLLNLAGVFFTITPMMWIFLQNPILIAIIPQLLNGIANAAFGIGFSNYMYANVDVKVRADAVARVNLLSGVGVVLGSLVGGFLLSHFVGTSKIFFIVFLVATVCRGAVSAFFLSNLHDVQSNHKKTLQFDIMHPLKSVYHDTQMVKTLVEK
jgi:MFS family permease